MLTKLKSFDITDIAPEVDRAVQESGKTYSQELRYRVARTFIQEANAGNLIDAIYAAAPQAALPADSKARIRRHVQNFIAKGKP